MFSFRLVHPAALAVATLGLSLTAACERAEPAPRSSLAAAPPAQPAAAPQVNPPASVAAQPAAPTQPETQRAEQVASAAPTSARGSVATRGAPTVKRLIVTPAVEAREPVAASTFAGEPVVAFLELSSTESAQIEVTFERGDARVGFVKLEVPAAFPRYRTWARTLHIREAGEWEAVVRTSDGTELARQRFTVGGARDAAPDAPHEATRPELRSAELATDDEPGC